MKFFKKLAIACLTLTMFAGLATFAACGGDNNNANGNNSNSEQPAQTEGFKFKIVKADGTPAVGYVVQLCKSTCIFSEPANENGEITFGGGEGEIAYDIHVWSALPQNGGAEVEFTGATQTPAAYSDDVITLTLKN
ncbi:MAG: hypothetical protein IJX09_04535 [Clostridia bacterium]|nr:hypothetical protein [Clostridia bacterium]